MVREQGAGGWWVSVMRETAGVVRCKSVYVARSSNDVNKQGQIMYGTQLPVGAGGGFGHKMDQISPKWDTSRTFSDTISVHFARTEI